MKQSFTTDHLKALLSFPFEDREWQHKLLIGSIFIFFSYIIPILPMMVVYGYCAQLIRGIVIEHQEPFLPNWDDWGTMFIDGLKIFGVMFIYALPGIVIVCGGYILSFGGIFVPPVMFSSIEASQSSSPELSIMMIFISTAGIILMSAIVMMVGWLLTLALILFSPVAIVHMVVADEFSAAFRFREIWAIFWANLGGFILTYVILIGLWIAIGFGLQLIYLTIILCCLLPFIFPPLTTYFLIIQMTLIAQAYRGGIETTTLLQTK